MEDTKPSANDLDENNDHNVESVTIGMTMSVDRTNNSGTNPRQNSNGKNIKCICLRVVGQSFDFYGDEDTKKYFLNKYHDELHCDYDPNNRIQRVGEFYYRLQMCLLKEGYKYSHASTLNRLLSSDSFIVESWIKEF